MLHVFKTRFNSIMGRFSNCVSFEEALRSLNSDFRINIDLVAKFTSSKVIDSNYARRILNYVSDFMFKGRIACSIS